MSDKLTEIYRFDRQLVWSGFKQLLPMSLFVLVFGGAFGLAAMQTGLNEPMTILMSTLVFAGASQFAGLELWGPDVPIFTLIATVLAINARHLLMGASLYPWLRHIPPLQRYGTMLFVSDANWALSLQAFNRGKPGMGILLGGGLVMWLFWIIGTWLGIYFGNAIQNPKSFGLDMTLGCFLLAMVVGGDKNPRILVIWVVAAATSLLAFKYLPENTNVILGAVAGGVIGVFWPEKINEH